MKTIIIILLLSSSLSAQVPKDWQKFGNKKDSVYLLTLPTSNGEYFVGCKTEKQVRQVKDMRFNYDTKQFLFFKPRKVIKVKIIID